MSAARSRTRTAQTRTAQTRTTTDNDVDRNRPTTHDGRHT